jgi:hypothetical protein
MSDEPVVIITVTCRCGLEIGEWENSIAEKYPFSCGRCDDTRTNSYPWTLTTRIESQS